MHMVVQTVEGLTTDKEEHGETSTMTTILTEMRTILRTGPDPELVVSTQQMNLKMMLTNFLFESINFPQGPGSSPFCLDLKTVTYERTIKTNYS